MFILLVVLDCLATFLLYKHIYEIIFFPHENNKNYFELVFVVFYPLASLFSPLMGLFSIYRLSTLGY